MKATRTLSTPRQQRGVYAIEFAMVFMIFFSILYAVICYGMLFAFRLGLQNAAEDGARAALQYQSSVEKRRTHAKETATAQIGWMPSVVTVNVSAQICSAKEDKCTTAAPYVCGITWSHRCQVTVLVQASNLNLLLPPLPSFALPAQIAGSASMLLDMRSEP
ncbi:pilus assembly protein [Variovorax sp. RO1]|uniref:TadE/TadG family type IV pilus assembly protein n=1 Tax=Variovorax sp. RO1 TaxID=2066034 RepID=UPI000C71676F|nr:TadE/TadG family type IV pilus assembly protein [Variovorax sp. RO1]PLC05879.1 pilus assembly protein [Variovorax sp. RO1]